METRIGPSSAQVPSMPRAPIGEIVEASTTGFGAVAAERFEPPPFGAFVKATTEGRTTFAVVSHVEHASIDPTRRAIPLGRTWEELRREQPQVLELLTTEFSSAIVAFTDGSGIHPFLPPVPPRVHDFVYVCSSEEVRSLSADLSFIRTLASTADRTEELLAAAIRGAACAHEEPSRFLLRAGREVADLYRQDYEQARSVLRRLGMRVAGDGHDHPPPEKVDIRRESDR